MRGVCSGGRTVGKRGVLAETETGAIIEEDSIGGGEEAGDGEEGGEGGGGAGEEDYEGGVLRGAGRAGDGCVKGVGGDGDKGGFRGGCFPFIIVVEGAF